MHNFNPDFLTRKVRNYVRALITSGCKDYFKLTDSDKREFAAHLIETYDRHSRHEFLTQSPDLDQTIESFRQSLLGFSRHNENFLETIKDNTVRYFEKTMIGIFYWILEDYESEWELAS